MKIYNFNKTSKVFFCGGSTDDEDTLLRCLQDGMTNGIEVEVHPKEIERQERINKRKSKRRSDMLYGVTPKTFKSCGDGRYNNSVVFVTGGFGFGTKEDQFFKSILDKINELASKNNSFIVFVRGYIDDPSYFSEKKFDFSNIVFAEDYSVIKLDGFDCLCVGGGMNVDRQWRMEQSNRIGRKLFFEGCGSTFDKDALSDAISNNNVAVIITSDVPTFIPPSVDVYNNSKWVNSDKTILKDMLEQRLVMDSIYQETVRFNKKPKIWCAYGSDEHGELINGIRYTISSRPYSIYDIQGVCEEFFECTLSGDKVEKKKKIAYKKISAEPPANGQRIAMPHWYEDAVQANQRAPVMDTLTDEFEMAAGEPMNAVGHSVVEPAIQNRVVPDYFAETLREFNDRIVVNTNNDAIRFTIDADAMNNIAVAPTNGVVNE